MDGFALWLIGVMFMWGMICKTHADDWSVWKIVLVCAASIFVWPYQLAYMLFTKVKE